jgi:hypothetical protein
MANEEDQMSFEIWCDLLERELKIALEDLEKIRKSDKAQGKNTCHMLRAALGNARLKTEARRVGQSLLSS